MDGPLFVMGFPRSGTTLLNRLVGEYFDVGLVNEGHFIVTFGRRLKKYGDLKCARNYRRLLHDLAQDSFFKILSRNYDVVIDWDRLGRPRSFPQIVKDILRQIAAGVGKTRIGSKNPAFGYHLALVDRLFPRCRVIHVVRDGRDCALSQAKLVWGHQNAYASAIYWRKYLRSVRRHAPNMQGRILRIRYEDLLGDPEATMSAVEHFVCDEPDGSITRRFLSESARLKRGNAGHWQTQMTGREKAIFEATAGEMLQAHGYPLTGDRRMPSRLARCGYRVHDRASREGRGLARKLLKNNRERK
jgi:hypothetical protein